MVDSNSTSIVFTEIFPVMIDKLPPLFAYQLNISGSDQNTIGGKLAYQFKNRLNGHWAWTQAQKVIITDISYSLEELRETIKVLWEEQPDPYAFLIDIGLYDTQNLTDQAIADFVAFGLLEDQDKDLKRVLSSLKDAFKNKSAEF